MNKMNLSNKTISNLLTIRYDPSSIPEKEFFSYKDFETKFSDPNGTATQTYLKHQLKPPYHKMKLQYLYH